MGADKSIDFTWGLKGLPMLLFSFVKWVVKPITEEGVLGVKIRLVVCGETFEIVSLQNHRGIC